jgi:prephenate dehydratase
MNSTPFDTRDSALTYQEAIQLLQNVDVTTVTSYPAVKPMGGQMFYISTQGDTTKRSK